jgi:hypothetical protein
MNILPGKNYIVTREIPESDESDHFDEGERVVVLDFVNVVTPRVLIKNRIGSEGWTDAGLLNSARGRPMRVMV